MKKLHLPKQKYSPSNQITVGNIHYFDQQSNKVAPSALTKLLKNPIFSFVMYVHV
jgi:hypothetical protein